MKNNNITITKQEYQDLLKIAFRTQSYLEMKNDKFWTKSTLLKAEYNLKETTDTTLKKIYQ